MVKRFSFPEMESYPDRSQELSTIARYHFDGLFQVFVCPEEIIINYRFLYVCIENAIFCTTVVYCVFNTTLPIQTFVLEQFVFIRSPPVFELPE